MQQIAEWLEKLGLSEYAQRFAENGIDVSVLRHLTDQDLKDIGVLLGHRRKMLAAIGELAGAAPLPPEPTARAEPKPQDTAERRQVTVMFSDLVGSTALSARMDPEDLREVISAYQKCVAETVRRFGGFVAKYMGDGVLVYFGYPQAHEDDAERAVRAGLELIAAVGGLKTAAPLQTRVGIATGLVVVGDLIGSGEAQERGIVGETPNLAARLQGMAEPNMVVIAESTRRLLGSLFDLRTLEQETSRASPARCQPGRCYGPVQWKAGSRHCTPARRPSSAAKKKSSSSSVAGNQQKPARATWYCSRQRRASANRGLWRRSSKCFGPNPMPHFNISARPIVKHSALFPVIACLERAAGFEHSDTSEAKFGKLEALITAKLQALPRMWRSSPNCCRFRFAALMRRSIIRRSARRKRPSMLSSVISRAWQNIGRSCLSLRISTGSIPPRTNGSTWPFSGSNNCRF